HSHEGWKGAYGPLHGGRCSPEHGRPDRLRHAAGSGNSDGGGVMILAILRFPFVLVILIYQSAFLALGQIWANKVRSTLTTIGIVIGIASVSAVIATLTGLKTNVLTEFESFGTNKIFIYPDWRAARKGNIPWFRIRFKPEHFDGLLDHCPSVAYFTRLDGMGGNQNVSFGGRTESNAQ